MPGSEATSISLWFARVTTARDRAWRGWLEGWSLCLTEVGFQFYGLPSQGLLDIRFLDLEQAKTDIPAFTAAGNTLQALPVGTADAQPSSVSQFLE